MEHDLKGRDPAGLAGFGYDDLLLNDVLQDRSDRTTAFGASLRIAAFAGRKLRRLWWSSIAELSAIFFPVPGKTIP